MDKPLQRVRQFHQTFLVKTPGTPEIPSKETCALRVRLIQEELDELEEAFKNNDLVGVIDALGDLTVVLDGTYDVCGLAPLKDAISEEIFNSNMSKADENGQPILREDGKILKGPRFFKPDLARILAEKTQEKDAA